MRIIKNYIKKHLFHLIAIAFIGLAPATSSLAHHSWSEFDAQLKVLIDGRVSELVWKSPHARLYVDVIDESGETINWNIELPSPNTLMRRGWTRKSLQPGDQVTVEGIRARNFLTIGIANSILDADGEAIFTGTTPVY